MSLKKVNLHIVVEHGMIKITTDCF